MLIVGKMAFAYLIPRFPPPPPAPKLVFALAEVGYHHPLLLPRPWVSLSMDKQGKEGQKGHNTMDTEAVSIRMVTSGHQTFVLIEDCGVCPRACAGGMTAQTLGVLCWTGGLRGG